MKVSVCIVDLPEKVHGISANKSGEHTIYINAHDSNTIKNKALLRGIARIKFGHFYSDKPYGVCDEEVNACACCAAMKLDAFCTLQCPPACELS